MKLFLRTILGASLLLSLFTFASCNKVDDEGNPVYQCDNDEFGSATHTGFSPLFVDANNPDRLPLDIVEYPCFRDSVTVFKENGETAENIVFNNSGQIGFQVISRDEDHTDMFINEQVREFYAYINYQHVDTFRFEFMFLETDCNYVVFDYARIFLNNNLLYVIEEETYLGAPDVYINSLRYNPCPN